MYNKMVNVSINRVLLEPFPIRSRREIPLPFGYTL